MLITGGIGPTKDDVTKTALCQYFDTRLVWNQEVYDHIEQMLTKRNFPINELTRSQAFVPEKCTVLKNGFGTAPITWFDHKGKIIVSMPGVPLEMQQVMEEEILPLLSKRIDENLVIQHHTMDAIGYRESLLAEKLAILEEELCEN